MQVSFLYVDLYAQNRELFGGRGETQRVGGGIKERIKGGVNIHNVHNINI
jgi:hypothetical protein